MRVVLNEMKKVWNWRILVIISVVCLMFFIMFMSYYVNYYSAGNHPQAEDVSYAKELVRRYGTAVSPEELASFIAVEQASLVIEAEAYFRTMPVFAEAGVFSYDDYTAMLKRYWENEFTEAESHAHWALLGEECDYVGFRLQALQAYEDHYGLSLITSSNPDSFYHILNEREKERFDESVAQGEHRSILSYWTYYYTNDYAKVFSILLMLSVLILVSPLLVSDRNSNVHHLQYSSKLGRKIVYRQFVATLFSAAALTTLLVLIFAAVFNVNGTYCFWNNNLSSDFNIGIYTVFSLTYGRWVMAMIALMYTMSLGVAALAFVLSRLSRNLITLVMKLIPLFAVMAFFNVSVFDGLFTILNSAFYRLLRVFGAEVYVCGVFLVVSLVVALLVLRKEKHLDVT